MAVFFSFMPIVRTLALCLFKNTTQNLLIGCRSKDFTDNGSYIYGHIIFYICLSFSISAFLSRQNIFSYASDASRVLFVSTHRLVVFICIKEKGLIFHFP